MFPCGGDKVVVSPSGSRGLSSRYERTVVEQTRRAWRGLRGGVKTAQARTRLNDNKRRDGTERTQETWMDWNFVEASWQRFRGEVRANWGRLTSAQLDVIAGRRARLASTIKEAYAVTGDEAERQIKNFEARNQHPRPVSFR